MTRLDLPAALALAAALPWIVALSVALGVVLALAWLVGWLERRLVARQRGAAGRALDVVNRTAVTVDPNAYRRIA